MVDGLACRSAGLVDVPNTLVIDGAASAASAALPLQLARDATVTITLEVLHDGFYDSQQQSPLDLATRIASRRANGARLVLATQCDGGDRLLFPLLACRQVLLCVCGFRYC